MSTFPLTDNHSATCRTSILEGATFHKMSYCKFLGGNPCKAIETFYRWDSCLWDFGFSMIFAHSAAWKNSELGLMVGILVKLSLAFSCVWLFCFSVCFPWFFLTPPLFSLFFASLFSSLLFSSLFSCLVSPLTCLFLFFSLFLLLLSPSPLSFFFFSLSSSLFSLCLLPPCVGGVCVVVCVVVCVCVCAVVWCGVVCRVVWHAEKPVCRLKTQCLPKPSLLVDVDTSHIVFITFIGIRKRQQSKDELARSEEVTDPPLPHKTFHWKRRRLRHLNQTELTARHKPLVSDRTLWSRWVCRSVIAQHL